MDKKYVINRFPICAGFYAAVAEKIGYKKEKAYSFGLTRAIFFAAAKNGFRGGYKKETYSK